LATEEKIKKMRDELKQMENQQPLQFVEQTGGGGDEENEDEDEEDEAMDSGSAGEEPQVHQNIYIYIHLIPYSF
jgi:hypothetical protein